MNRHPAFSSGREAFRYGQLDNPNKPDTTAFKEWQAGFDHEYFLNLHSLNRTKVKDYV